MHLSYHSARTVCLFVCQPPLAPSLLHGRKPQPQRLSPWPFGTCPAFILTPTCPHGQLEGAGVELPGFLFPMILSSSSV